MSTALAPGVSPERLAPGDPDGARARASRLRTYASVAEEARQRGRVALERFADAEAASARWESERSDYDAALAAETTGGPPAGPVPPSVDPGADARRAAERSAQDIQDDVEAAERALAERLERAGEAAPDEPGFWDKVWDAGGEFLAGAGEATVGLAEFVYKLTPIYALVDPQGSIDNFVSLGQGIAYGVTHPVEFAQAMVNWDLWLENPARAAGQMVPDLLLAIGTAGAGTAATAASRAGRAVENLDDVAGGARAAERLDDGANPGVLTGGARAAERLDDGANPGVLTGRNAD